jgi:hypothetical protein
LLCSRWNSTDQLAAAADTDESEDGSTFASMAEVSAAKQRWEIVNVAVAGDGDEASANQTVQLRNRFYSARPGAAAADTAAASSGGGRCLGLQPPNSIAYNPPYRHPTRPNPRPVWSAPWQAVLLPCNKTDRTQLWRFESPGPFPSELASGADPPPPP